MEFDPVKLQMILVEKIAQYAGDRQDRSAALVGRVESP